MSHLSTSQQAFGRRGGGRGKKRSGGKKSAANSIDISKFIHKAVAQDAAVVTPVTHRFADFNFDQRVMRNVERRGFEHPTPIQDQTIPLVRQGHDVIGLANTGTGKTAAFLLPLLDAFLRDSQMGPALILAPTRELAMQIEQDFRALARGTRITAAVCVGGQPIGRQIRELKRQPHLIIGTPGRIKDLLNQDILNLTEVSVLVLDEVDRMLDMGFIRDIRAIVGMTPDDRQSLFFSATMSKEVTRLTADFLRNPLTVSVRTAETSQQVDQDVVHVASIDDKLDALVSLLRQDECSKAIVFGGTKWGVQKLSRKLCQCGIEAAAIHGDKTQGQRIRALKDFKSDQAKVLVATDVAARGLDIPEVSHVINYDLPQNYEDYTHRIGRTGRAGNKGVALTFVVGHPLAAEASAMASHVAPKSTEMHQPFAEALAEVHSGGGTVQSRNNAHSGAKRPFRKSFGKRRSR